MKAFLGEGKLELTPKEFELLTLMAFQPGARYSPVKLCWRKSGGMNIQGIRVQLMFISATCVKS